MKLVPLFDRVVLKKMVEEETTASGIVLPGKGDKVLYSKYAGSDIEIDGEKFIVLKQNDILAIMK